MQCISLNLAYMLCYQVNYIVCHYETFNIALKLAFGEV